MLINRINNLLGRQDGNITLESTIVFPVYLAFLLLLINFIKISIVYVAVDHAVSETTKLVATHSYPLKYAEQALDKLKNSTTGKVDNKVPVDTGGIQELVNFVINLGLDAGLEKFTQMKINDYLPEGIRPDITVEQVKMCSKWDSKLSNKTVNGYKLGPEDVAIVVNYKVKLWAPFIPATEFTMSNAAVERAWLDD